jgi:hypothetical protein
MSKPYLGEPTPVQLVEAVAGYLEKVAVPQLEGHAAFHGRVAINVLNIIAREMQLGPAAAEEERARLAALLGKDGDLDSLRRALCAQLRAGEAGLETPGLVEHLLASAIDRVRIEQPNYGSLKRV